MKQLGKRVTSLFSSLMLWTLFIAGLSACVGAGPLYHLHGTHQHLATYGGIALSLVAGTRVMRKEPLRSWLATRPVLWFLFLFNLTVAVAVCFLVHGAQGIMAAVGLGVVSLGAGFGLLRGRAKQV
jgi:hypothetical protein